MTLDNKVDGAFLVLVDIDALKRTEQTITAAHAYVESRQAVGRVLLVP